MTVYDPNGIPILGKEDDVKIKIEELSRNLMIARGLIHQLQEQVELLKSSNTNILCFLFSLMKKTDNNRFRVPIKKLESLRSEFLSQKIILKTYQDKAKNVVIYREDVKPEKDNESEAKK
ncbi:MAG: hypothetical protein ACFFDY_00365 [Candidatus Thorarchaeota archaeon]